MYCGAGVCSSPLAQLVGNAQLSMQDGGIPRYAVTGRRVYRRAVSQENRH